MSTFEDIYPDKPIFLRGYHTNQGGFADLVDGADEVVIQIAKPFIDMMKVSVFLAELESKLQGMSTRSEGDLLTTWLSIDDFLTMISEDASDLAETVKAWKELGANEVYIDGFKIEAAAA